MHVHQNNSSDIPLGWRTGIGAGPGGKGGVCGLTSAGGGDCGGVVGVSGS